jgi:IS5 family transposase
LVVGSTIARRIRISRFGDENGHAAVRGRPVAFALTPGNVADVAMAIPLLGAAAKPKRLLADKAYDADSLRQWLKQKNIRAAIPSTASREDSIKSMRWCEFAASL